MGENPGIQPLPIEHRRFTFFALLALFILMLPFLYLYATGYRLNFNRIGEFVSTGGLYIGADRTGASIYIDDELVRETRTFRTAFYAQGLEPGTHRVHVQKEGHNTWVKELPVYPHVVTEATAFNIPLIPHVRIISPWKDKTGASVLFASSTMQAILDNPVIVVSATKTSAYIKDTEYGTLLALFSATTTRSGTSPDKITQELRSIFPAATSSATSSEVRTTTKIFNSVRLFEKNSQIFAEWIGSRENMPYYYCAEDFSIIGTSSAGALLEKVNEKASTADLIGPVQYVPDNAVCNPAIRIQANGETIRTFDFYPGSSDLVVLALVSGIYVSEIDDRAWQNMQPLFSGANLDFRVKNGSIYIYDGTLIYQVLIEN